MKVVGVSCFVVVLLYTLQGNVLASRRVREGWQRDTIPKCEQGWYQKLLNILGPLEGCKQRTMQKCDEGWYQELVNILGKESVEKIAPVHDLANEKVSILKSKIELTPIEEQTLGFCYESCFTAELIGLEKTLQANQVFFDCFPETAPQTRVAADYGGWVAVFNLDCVAVCNKKYVNI
eukprot:TRINITY_DN11741_c0_g1_i1.p3 TRINITY_DN11741_c0_g1~~TRINITY_DN11741_c0_g1_i1.p3  ORF type:complete len:178 (+),score=13.15 TRINITY_DN11741_c0_g1_i1:87-620(+)